MKPMLLNLQDDMSEQTRHPMIELLNQQPANVIDLALHAGHVANALRMRPTGTGKLSNRHSAGSARTQSDQTSR